MKIVRAFMRVASDRRELESMSPETISDWTLRMDSLLSASEIDLNEFILDAIMAISVRTGTPIERVVNIVDEATQLEGTEEVRELIQGRWNSIMAALEEHMDTPEARKQLADRARTADWE